MSFFSRTKKEAPPPPPPVPSLRVNSVEINLLMVLGEVITEGPDLDLALARIADSFRAAGHAPADPEEVEALAKGLDAGALARLGAFALVARRGGLGEALGTLLGQRGALAVAGEGFVAVARATPLLTLELIAESGLRREELARRFLAGLGAQVEDETPEASAAMLERLDYGRLLAELERAKLSAEGRAEYLKKLQEEHDASRPRRGKW